MNNTTILVVIIAHHWKGESPRQHHNCRGILFIGIRLDPSWYPEDLLSQAHKRENLWTRNVWVVMAQWREALADEAW